MGNGDAEADPGAPARLPLLNRSEHLRVVASPAIGQMTSKLGNDAVLIPSRHRHDHLIGRKKLGQEHGIGWDGMDSNLYRATEWGNALV